MGKPTLMSGELGVKERLSYRAVDGTVKGQAAAISCITTPGTTHTEWWMVDLLQLYRIRNVLVVPPGEQGILSKIS